MPKDRFQEFDPAYAIASVEFYRLGKFWGNIANMVSLTDAEGSFQSCKDSKFELGMGCKFVKIKLMVFAAPKFHIKKTDLRGVI